MDVNEIAAQEQLKDTKSSASVPGKRTTAQGPAQTVHDDVPVQEHPPPTLEAEISQLTSSLTSWWGSVTKQSQATLDQARSHIEKQGGVWNAAKSEWSKLEEHLNDAQKRARETAFADAEDGKPGEGADRAGPGPVHAPSEDDILEEAEQRSRSGALDKGKGRALHDGNDKAQDRRADKVVDEAPQMISADGTIFDAALPSKTRAASGGAHGRNPSASIDLNAVAKEAQVQATQLANQATSFFSRIGSQLASDPRVANLQKSIKGSLAGGASSDATAASATEEKTVDEKAGGASGERSGPSAGTAGGKTALPSWATTQALARKYWAEAEAVARDVGKDVRELVNEVVQVVPPSEAEARAAHASNVSGKQKAGGSRALKSDVGISQPGEEDKLAKETRRAQNLPPVERSSSAKAAPGGATEEDDFDWDEDGEASKSASKTASAVKEAPIKPAEDTVAKTATSTTAPALPASGSRDSQVGLETTTGPSTDRFEVADEGDGDSDWE